MNNKVMTKEWFNFQEKIAQHFRSLGVKAETNQPIKGIRTDHDLDVFVTSQYLCTNIKWVIEAKYWKTKVPKEKVLALRTIVDDIGADKGFIISEVGFQSGALEAAKNTNIVLYTFEELVLNSTNAIQGLILESFSRRIRFLEHKYYAHSKKIRIKYNLRNDFLDYPIQFSGNILIFMIYDAIFAAKNNNYPIALENYILEKAGDNKADNFLELTNWLNLNLNWFDEKMYKAECEMILNYEYLPDINHIDTNFMSIYEAGLSLKGKSDEEKVIILKNFNLSIN